MNGTEVSVTEEQLSFEYVWFCQMEERNGMDFKAVKVVVEWGMRAQESKDERNGAAMFSGTEAFHK